MRIGSVNAARHLVEKFAPKVERALDRLVARSGSPRDAFVARAQAAATATAPAKSHWHQGQESVASRPTPTMDAATARAVVTSLYRGALGREPDAEGLAHWSGLAERGQLGAVVDGIVHSAELREKSGGLGVEELSRQLYAGILGRAPDPEGQDATVAATLRGHLGHRIIDMLLSPEHADRLARPPAPAPAPTPAPAPAPGPAPTLPPEPGPALSTVPMRAEYAGAKIDTSSDAAAVKSAAAWVKASYPELFTFPNGDDRQVAYETMTHVIGVMRAAGYDAFRVVNHASRPKGDPFRYGSDALVLNGRIYDCYLSHGDPNASHPQALDVGPHIFSRPRE